MDLKKIESESRLTGVDRVNEIMSMQINGSNILPKPITYKDIDFEMTNFVSSKFNTTFGEQEIKTFFFAQQRMSEFTKTWEMVDENKNVLPNFKIVTRENNPKPGTLQGGLFNIPGEPLFTIATFDKWDGNKNITVTHKMKQPYCVDMLYNIKFVTNRLNLLNELNNKVNDEFKSKQSYLVVNGHYMPVTLEDIGDESDYELDQRKIFVQNYQLKVAGYIINEKDIIVEENSVAHMVSIVLNSNKPNVISNTRESNGNIVIEFPRKSRTVMSFKANDNYHIVNVLYDLSNISAYTIKVNDEIVWSDFYLQKYDRVQVSIQRISMSELSSITLVKSKNTVK